MFLMNVKYLFNYSSELHKENWILKKSTVLEALRHAYWFTSTSTIHDTVWGPSPVGVPPSQVWRGGGYLRWGTPHWGTPSQVWQGGTWGGVPPFGYPRCNMVKHPPPIISWHWSIFNITNLPYPSALRAEGLITSPLSLTLEPSAPGHHLPSIFSP